MGSKMRKPILKITAFIILFVVVIGGYGVYRYFKNAKDAPGSEMYDILMGKPTLPIIYTKTGKNTVNETHGYTMDMDTRYMRDSVTVLTTGKTLEMEIVPYEAAIVEIAMEITDLEGNVVEEYTFQGWSANEDGIDLIHPCSEDVVQGEEYILNIKIATENQEIINYYSILKYIPESRVDEQIEFIKDYSDKSFDYEKAMDLIPYIEPSSDNPNNNLGHVTITSSFRQLTWAGLGMERTSDPVVKITDISTHAGCYQLSYEAQAENEYGVMEKYHVVEFYRVCYNRNQLYLISYDRTMDQIYDTETGNPSTKRMNLGVDSDLAVEYKASNSTKYIGFVKERQLFLMDTNKNEMTNIFSFYNETNNGIRDRYDQHDIQIVSIDDDGNAEFVVYGYMNRGEHEGKAGVTLYRYIKKENIVQEVIYISSNKSFQLLKEIMGKLCYVTEDGTMYIYMDSSIYSIDIEGKEYVEVVSQLGPDNFAISTKGDKVAWVEEVDGVSNIRIKNFMTGQDQIIKGNGKSLLVPLGFMSGDFVYGTAKSKNILQNEYGDTNTLISSIKIVDEDLNLLKTYNKKGKLIVNVQVQDAIIKFETAVKAAQNKKTIYKVEGNDQILNNEEQQEDAVTLRTIVTDKKQTELIINYANHVISSEPVKLIYPVKINTNSQNALEIKTSEIKDENFYVYGQGKLVMICVSVEKSVALAKEMKGFVVDSENNKVWDYVEKFRN